MNAKFKKQLEDHNFRVDSKDWKKVTLKQISISEFSFVERESYLVNPKGDICEIVTGDYQGEQLFTWDAAIRETKKAGKRMPTDKEFTELLKTKEDMPDIAYVGHRAPNGTFFNRRVYAYFWSSTESGANAWNRALNSTPATVYRYTYDKAYGFFVRCLK